ncbi:hypothetical protein PMZ80_008143 [Knufia obscura]|nr:hypothetical protein PMZ80_008143 [Knufia obscura]
MAQINAQIIARANPMGMSPARKPELGQGMTNPVNMQDDPNIAVRQPVQPWQPSQYVDSDTGENQHVSQKQQQIQQQRQMMAQQQVIRMLKSNRYSNSSSNINDNNKTWLSSKKLDRSRI